MYNFQRSRDNLFSLLYLEEIVCEENSCSQRAQQLPAFCCCWWGWKAIRIENDGIADPAVRLVCVHLFPSSQSRNTRVSLIKMTIMSPDYTAWSPVYFLWLVNCLSEKMFLRCWSTRKYKKDRDNPLIHLFFFLKLFPFVVCFPLYYYPLQLKQLTLLKLTEWKTTVRILVYSRKKKSLLCLYSHEGKSLEKTVLKGMQECMKRNKDVGRKG